MESADILSLEDVQKLVENNEQMSFIRERMITLFNDLKTAGMSNYDEDFADLAEETNIPSAKRIIAARHAREQRIPILGKNMDILGFANKIIWCQEFRTQKGVRGSNRTVTVLADSSFLVNKGAFPVGYYYTNFIDDTLAEKSNYVIVNNINTFIEKYNGRVAKWAIIPLLKGAPHELPAYFKNQLSDHVSVYLGSLGMKDLFTRGADAFLLPIPEFMTTIRNLTDLGIYDEKKANAGRVYGSILHTIIQHMKMPALPANAMYLDDPLDAEEFKELTIMDMLPENW